MAASTSRRLTIAIAACAAWPDSRPDTRCACATSCVLIESHCIIDFNKLGALLDGKYSKNKANRILTSLLADAGIAERG